MKPTEVLKEALQEWLKARFEQHKATAPAKDATPEEGIRNDMGNAWGEHEGGKQYDHATDTRTIGVGGTRDASRLQPRVHLCHKTAVSRKGSS
jgi:hypothetical protein